MYKCSAFGKSGMPSYHLRLLYTLYQNCTILSELQLNIYLKHPT